MPNLAGQKQTNIEYIVEAFVEFYTDLLGSAATKKGSCEQSGFQHGCSGKSGAEGST